MMTLEEAINFAGEIMLIASNQDKGGGDEFAAVGASLSMMLSRIYDQPNGSDELRKRILEAALHKIHH